ncbi:multiple epidermal growth factor-like domains 10 [Elysia marginata]|uniref:Multiple epidermal growth factor-like domains 10 n=1 Tax=Elysia marginata TaxID=1093978 RepID=A0AAV4IYF8_9GAST|nr:multiple epidermal growth factor-like domains 10 [Elysia marginata]
MDIDCPTSDAVSCVQISGLGVAVLCSLYISGGRNVALKQTASQSSRYVPTSSENAFKPENAVDGKLPFGTIENVKSTCTHTDTKEGRGWWAVNFSTAVNITRFRVYNRDEVCCRRRLDNFRLTVHPETDTITGLYRYKDQHKEISLNGHTVVPSPRIDFPAHQVRIDVAEESETGILTLCEVEVFGDINCPAGRFGLTCERQCNCVNGGSCFVHSGGCPSGCAPGYTGEDCWECEPGRYGERCSQNCNATCGADNSCDHNSGACSQGCKLGYSGNYCESECPDSTYGEGCTGKCSVTCGGSQNACDRVNGTCLEGCNPGFVGERCDLECPPTTYGPECLKNCSTTCKEKVCHHTDGSCVNGCEDGYWGWTCESECSNGTFGFLCENRCSENCKGHNNRSVCDPIGGACINGCKDGYWGGMCDSSTYKTGLSFSFNGRQYEDAFSLISAAQTIGVAAGAVAFGLPMTASLVLLSGPV